MIDRTPKQGDSGGLLYNGSDANSKVWCPTRTQPPFLLFFKALETWPPRRRESLFQPRPLTELSGWNQEFIFWVTMEYFKKLP